MPVTGVKEVKAKTKKVFADIREKKAVQFMNAVISIGVNHSKEMTPIAYSNLINSITTDVTVTLGKVEGNVMYNANYALYLNGDETYTPLWKPVPLPKYEVKGGRSNELREISQPRAGAPATNMQAKPRFLNRGFEDAESVAMIDQAKGIFKI